MAEYIDIAEIIQNCHDEDDREGQKYIKKKNKTNQKQICYICSELVVIKKQCTKCKKWVCIEHFKNILNKKQQKKWEEKKQKEENTYNNKQNNNSKNKKPLSDYNIKEEESESTCTSVNSSYLEEQKEMDLCSICQKMANAGLEFKKGKPGYFESSSCLFFC